MTLSIFLDRLSAMQQGAQPFGDDGPAAWKVVESRGLSEALLDEIRVVARDALRPAPQLSTKRSARREELANQALWAWYLEWSRIIRTAVKNKALLRSMGFAPPVSRKARTQQAPAQNAKPTNTASPSVS